MDCTRDIVNSIMDNLYCAPRGIFIFLFKMLRTLFHIICIIVCSGFAFSYFPMFFQLLKCQCAMLIESQIQQNAWEVHNCWDVMHFHSLPQFLLDVATDTITTVYSGADQRKHQSSASQAFVREIHWWPVNFPHKRPETRKRFPFDDVIMKVPQNGTRSRCYEQSSKK